MENNLYIVIDETQKFEPCIIQSAFNLDNGKRIIIYTGSLGIKSFECDENWKPYPKPFAECPISWSGKTPTEYHLWLRNECHKKENFVPEQSTIIDWVKTEPLAIPIEQAQPKEQPSVEALAEQIAKNWDVYYTREGEPQNNVISAMVEMHQAASQPISAEDWKEKVEKAAVEYGDNLRKQAREWHKGQHVGLPQSSREIEAQITGFVEGIEYVSQSLQQPSMRWETERDPSIGDNYYCIIYDDWSQQRKAIVEWAEHSNGGYRYYDWCLSDLDNGYGVREDTKVIAWLDESTSQHRKK